MRSRTRWLVLATLPFLTVGWIGCGEKGAQVNEAAVAEYAALVEDQTALNGLRQTLADLRVQAAAAAESEGEGEEGEPVEGEGGAVLDDQIAKAESDVLEASESFNGRIAAYFNEVDPMLEGEAPSENQAAVIRMKSAEDIVIASEYIEAGGDYRRAIRILDDSLQLDPENPDLQAALDRAHEMRFMTEERLAGIKKGMTQPEVKTLLGPVNLRNIREYPERNVIAWFYPKDDSGAASAVWFRKNREGDLTVYKTDFDQIKGRDEEPAEGE